VSVDAAMLERRNGACAEPSAQRPAKAPESSAAGVTFSLAMESASSRPAACDSSRASRAAAFRASSRARASSNAQSRARATIDHTCASMPARTKRASSTPTNARSVAGSGRATLRTNCVAARSSMAGSPPAGRAFARRGAIRVHVDVAS